MKKRIAKKILKKGIRTPKTQAAAYRFLRYLTNDKNAPGMSMFAKWLKTMIIKKYVDINNLNLSNFVNLSFKNWHLTTLWKIPIPAGILLMDFQTNEKKSTVKMMLPASIHEINLKGEFSL